MKVDRITEVCVFSDVLDSGPFEDEPLYNKAREYKRYDICLFIADARRNSTLSMFAENIQLYEKTGEQQYKDVCLFIANARRNRALVELVEFVENIQLYEKTGEQQYKDIATGRYYHRILWDEVIRRLRNGYDESLDADVLKESIIDELDLPKPYQHSCFACTAKCEVCPISDLAGRCSSNESAYAHFVDALGCSDKDIEEAIKQAKRIRDAWTR